MGQSFTNNWEQTPHTVLPNMKLTLSGGKRFKTNGVNWGLLTGWTYRVQDSVLERTTRTYETGVTDLQLRSSADVVQSRQRVSLAGLISLGAESDKRNTVQAITLITRISDKEANIVNAFFNITDSPYSDFYTRQLGWVERMLLSQQWKTIHSLMYPAGIWIGGMASPLHHGVSLIEGQSTMAKTQMVQNIVCAEKLVTT